MSFATRAMNIGAPAQDVWPRLVQMGYHRAGWYTFALIDNQGTPHPKRVLLELQELAQGESRSGRCGYPRLLVAAIVDLRRGPVYTTSRNLLTQGSFASGEHPPRMRYRKTASGGASSVTAPVASNVDLGTMQSPGSPIASSASVAPAQAAGSVHEAQGRNAGQSRDRDGNSPSPAQGGQA